MLASTTSKMNPAITYLENTQKPVDNTATGKTLKAFRISCGVSQSDLAKKLGITGVALHHREKGRFAWTQESFDQYIHAVKQIK